MLLTSGVWRERSMPAIRSARFSRCARAAASASEACSESVKTDAPDPPKYGSPTNPAVSGAHDIVAPTSRLRESSILPWSSHSLHEEDAISHCKIKKCFWWLFG